MGEGRAIGNRRHFPSIIKGGEMALQYNGMKMSDGTEYRVLLDYRQLLNTIDSALKAGGLVTLPMGMSGPGHPVTVNPQHVVSFTDYSEA
jgi:hypothetical protein